MALLSFHVTPGGVLAVVLLLITGYVVSAVHSWYRLRHVPGPFLAKFSYAWLAKALITEKQYEAMKGVGEKYGTLVRVAPNYVITDDPEVLRRMNSAKNNWTKSEWYLGNRFNPYHDTMINLLDPVPHDRLKAKLSPGYTGRGHAGLESDIDEQLANLTDLIHRKYVCEPGREFRPFDITNVIPLFTLDVISKLSLGQEFGCLRQDRDIHDFYYTLERHLVKMGLCQDIPYLRKVLFSKLGLKWFGPKVTDPAGMGKIMKLARDAADKRYAPDAKEQRDIVGSWMKHGLTRDEIEAEMAFMFIAGSDTTAMVIRITLLHLLATPTAYARLRAEVAAAVREGRASRPITDKEARQLPYLQAVIYEGLRIRPVTAAIFPKTVPEGPGAATVVAGHPLPPGTDVGWNIAAVLRSRARFGADADVFRPERLLELPDERARADMQRDIELTFGYGRWMCGGKPIALMELNKVYFELFREFDFQLLNPQHAMESHSAALFMDRGLHARVTRSSIAV
ncbi:cytochrome P450 [Xylariomycetidae sp. FL0641]|nr:cytochrome P450 [Xylariomycetidae sp. FL0641]